MDALDRSVSRKLFTSAGIERIARFYPTRASFAEILERMVELEGEGLVESTELPGVPDAMDPIFSWKLTDPGRRYLDETLAAH